MGLEWRGHTPPYCVNSRDLSLSMFNSDLSIARSQFDSIDLRTTRQACLVLLCLCFVLHCLPGSVLFRPVDTTTTGWPHSTTTDRALLTVPQTLSLSVSHRQLPVTMDDALRIVGERFSNQEAEMVDLQNKLQSMQQQITAQGTTHTNEIKIMQEHIAKLSYTHLSEIQSMNDTHSNEIRSLAQDLRGLQEAQSGQSAEMGRQERESRAEATSILKDVEFLRTALKTSEVVISSIQTGQTNHTNALDAHANALNVHEGQIKRMQSTVSGVEEIECVRPSRFRIPDQLIDVSSPDHPPSIYHPCQSDPQLASVTMQGSPVKKTTRPHDHTTPKAAASLSLPAEHKRRLQLSPLDALLQGALTKQQRSEGTVRLDEEDEEDGEDEDNSDDNIIVVPKKVVPTPRPAREVPCAKSLDQTADEVFPGNKIIVEPVRRSSRPSRPSQRKRDDGRIR